jgi:hypothetical protein
VSLFHAVHVATGDFDAALKKMFGIRSESKRINVAEQLGSPEYRRLNLAAEFQEALTVMRHCLNIRNQYAHWVWWDDHSGPLAFANVEDLVKYPGKVTDFANLGAHHVDVALLKAQEGYFVYADDLLSWVNFEGRFAGKNPLGLRPASVAQPRLYL